jgi:hypothetical protein
MVQRRFRTKYHTEPPTDKRIREWYKKFQQSGCLSAAKRAGWLGPSTETVEHVQPVCAECAGHLTEASAIPSLRDMLTSEVSWQKCLAHARQSRLKAPASLFISQHTGSPSAGISCTTHELFCSLVVLCGTWSKTVALSWLTQFWQIPRHRTPYPLSSTSFIMTAPSGETCKYAMMPVSQKNLERFSAYWYAPFCSVRLGCCAAEFGSSGGTYELRCIFVAASKTMQLLSENTQKTEAH